MKVFSTGIWFAGLLSNELLAGPALGFRSVHILMASGIGLGAAKGRPCRQCSGPA